MNTDSSSKATRETVRQIADEVFKDHSIAWDEATRVWSCRAPSSSAYGFRLFFAPGVVVMWGDLGEFVWRHADHDALEWFVTQGGKAGDYPDYFLGKIQASRGPAKVFYADDAEEYIRDCIKDGAGDKERLRELLRQLKTARSYAEDDLEAVWHREWQDIMGDETPGCRGWSASALWAWYAARTFARLHGQYTATQAPVGGV